jgi:hypothetical protein
MSPLQKARRLILLREIIAVYCENHTRNSQIHSVGITKMFSMLKRLIHIVTTGASGVKATDVIRTDPAH